VKTHRRNPAQATASIASWAGRRLRSTRNDDGFFLLESIVAIAIITIIMAALTAFFSNAVKSNNEARQRQVAVQVADSALDSLRAVPATDLVTDRDQTDVLAQFQATLNTPVASWVLGTASTAAASTVMKPIYDATAVDGDGVTAVVPTVPKVTTVNGLDYSVSKYVGTCAVLAGGANGNSSSCLPSNLSLSNVIAYYRGVVAVTWPSSHCSGGTCTFVTATLLTGAVDPTFNLNQSPAPLPVAVSPGSQSSYVDDTISNVAFTMKTGTGVPTATWTTTSTLPAGITLNADGTFSGAPTAPTGSPVTITATLTDGFLRTSTASLTWTVLPKLAAASPGPQTSVLGTAISPLTLTASAGSGTPYTWTDPSATLPPGLTLATVSNQGKITGTPTRAGTYPVTITVKDSSGHTATVSWTWTVGYGPLVATNPGTVINTKGAPATLQLTATGGSGTVTWTSSTLPAGLSLNSSGLISGTPSAVGSTSVTVTATDTAANAVVTQSFTWSIVAAPSVTAPATQTTTVGVAVNLQLVTNCPNAPCSYALTSGPSGLSISATGLITGNPTAAGTFSSAKITVTDAANVSASSSTFTWNVNAAPSIGVVGTQTTYVNTAASLNTALLVSGGTAPYTYSASGLPSWLSINSSTGIITGTAPGTKAATSGITVTVKDAFNIATATASFKWIVTDLRLAIPDQWTSPGAGVTPMDIDTYLSGGSTPYTSAYSVTVANLPSGITYNTTSHTFGGTAPATRVQATMTVIVTDSQGASVTDSFIWYVASLRLNLGDQVTAPNTAVNLDIDNYVTGGTASAISVSGQPSWLTYNSTTNAFTGTAPASATPVSPIVITVQESSGFTFSRTITWYVSDLRWSGVPANRSSFWYSTVSVSMSAYDFGGTGPYTYWATNLPGGLKIDPATGLITNTGWISTGTFSVSVIVTDSTGATATTTFTWTVS